MTGLALPPSRPLRILHVIDGIGVGGAEHILVRLVERLQAAGHQNIILSLVEPGPLAARLTAAGATVAGLGFQSGRLPGPAALRLRTAFRRHRPDVVQGWMYHGNLAASFGRLVAGSNAPIAWSMHNTLEPPPEFKWFTRMAIQAGAWLSSRVGAIVYVSAASAPQHEALGFARGRRVVIPNGTDCERFRPDPAARTRLRTGLGLAPDVPLVGMFARFDPMKGHLDLLAAARRLTQEGRKLHLLMAGSGVEPANRPLVQAIDGIGLGPHTTLLGERHDIESLMPGLDLLVLPSVWGEAFPLVLGEAMASAVPCVATDIGDCAWIIGDAGITVPPNDLRALTGAIGRLLAEPPAARRRLGAAARQRVLDHFSLELTAERYQALYLTLAAGLDLGQDARRGLLRCAG